MSDPPPGARLWNIVRGAMAAKALGIAADLGLADALADGPRPASELAAETGVDPDGLQRLLRALASDGVFSEQEPGVFANSELSEPLRRDHPDRWHEFAHFFGGLWYQAVGETDAAVRTGEATFPRIFGTDYWSWLAEHPEEGAAFNRAMAGARKHAEALAKLEWREGETVADLGGGCGVLLVDLLRRRPELRGILFDLPETAREAEAHIAEAGLADRCEVVAGSFFQQVPSADAFVLSTVLHDWDDERVSAILRVVRAAATTHARLLISEAVIPRGNDPHGGKWLDLLMLVLAGGRERTAEEWQALLERAGFRIDELEDGLIQASCR
jgi:hypothetical protein